MKDAYNKYVYEKTDYNINSFPEKEIILADIIRLTDKKTILYIIDRNTEELLYNDRAEYITWNSEGCASSLCSKKVAYIDSCNSDNDLALEIHLIMEE